MRIQHNISAMNAYRNYSNNTSAVNKNLEKLSSGYRINRAGDDAAGLAVSQKMRLQITGLEQAQKNAKSGISYVQTAEGALQEVHEMLERMYTLAEQSANGTFDNNTDREQLQKEVTALTDEIERIGKTANFNGIGIFAQYDTSDGGTSGTNDAQFWIGAENLASNMLSMTAMNLSSANIGMSGAVQASGNLGNISYLEAKSTTVRGANAVNVNIKTATKAMASLSAIKNATNAVSDMRGTMGAIQNRLEHTIKNLSVTQENMQDAESVIRDTDVADEMMKYTKNNILIQSAQAMLAQANQLPQGVLQLLQ